MALVLFASESAPSATETVASSIATAIGGKLLDLSVIDLDSDRWRGDASCLVIVCPTYYGHPPEAALKLLEYFDQRPAQHIQFAVYGEHQCAAIGAYAQ